MHGDNGEVSLNMIQIKNVSVATFSGVFILLLLSGERNFGVRLNKVGIVFKMNYLFSLN